MVTIEEISDSIEIDTTLQMLIEESFEQAAKKMKSAIQEYELYLTEEQKKNIQQKEDKIQYLINKKRANKKT